MNFKIQTKRLVEAAKWMGKDSYLSRIEGGVALVNSSSRALLADVDADLEAIKVETLQLLKELKKFPPDEELQILVEEGRLQISHPNQEAFLSVDVAVPEKYQWPDLGENFINVKSLLTILKKALPFLTNEHFSVHLGEILYVTDGKGLLLHKNAGLPPFILSVSDFKILVKQLELLKKKDQVSIEVVDDKLCLHTKEYLSVFDRDDYPNPPCDDILKQSSGSEIFLHWEGVAQWVKGLEKKAQIVLEKEDETLRLSSGYFTYKQPLLQWGGCTFKAHLYKERLLTLLEGLEKKTPVKITESKPYVFAYQGDGTWALAEYLPNGS